jgi:hypothetical protein
VGTLKGHSKTSKTGLKKRKTDSHNHRDTGKDLSSKRRNGEFCFSTLASLRRQAENTEKSHASLKKNPETPMTEDNILITSKQRQSGKYPKKQLLNTHNHSLPTITSPFLKTLAESHKHGKYLNPTITV